MTHTKNIFKFIFCYNFIDNKITIWNNCNLNNDIFYIVIIINIVFSTKYNINYYSIMLY